MVSVAAIDTETTGLTPHHGCRPFMFQACNGTQNFIWEGKVNPKNRLEVSWDKKDLIDFLDFVDELDQAVFANAKFDIRMIFLTLQDHGLEKGWLNLIFSKFEDVFLSAHVTCSGEPQKLSYLALKYLDWYNDEEHLLSEAVLEARGSADYDVDIGAKGHPAFGGTKSTKWYKTDYWLAPEACRIYGIDDVEITYKLWEMYQDVLDSEGLWKPYNNRKRLLEVFYYLEEAGVNMYEELVERDIDELDKECEELRQKIEFDNAYQHSLDLSRTDHLKFLLFEKLGLDVTMETDKGNPSVNKEALDFYQEQYPKLESIKDLKKYRTRQTRKGSIRDYASWLCSDGRLRASYWITGTRATRQAVEKPNLQNIGKAIRHLFGPPPGKVWLDFDLVNIEMRRWVYYVGNSELEKVFSKGGSVHLLIAETLYPEEFKRHGADFKNVYKETLYQWIKNGNFSALFGAGERKADRTYHMQGAFRKIRNRFPEVEQFTNECIQEAWWNYERFDQHSVTVDGGYRLDVNPDRGYTAVNVKVQGSAGIIMGDAMIMIYDNPDYQKSSCQMIQQVHDNAVTELDREELSYDLYRSIKKSIEDAGLQYMPTCEAECEIKTHYNESPLVINDKEQTIKEVLS